MLILTNGLPRRGNALILGEENGKLEQYKLAPEGIKQAELAGESFLKVLKEDNVPLENVRICYSPFSRTTHTAQVVASVLDVSFERPQCMVLDDLRECFFGPSYELKSHENEKDPFMQPEGGESVADVVTRLTNALINMESQFRGVGGVSHGDSLQIFETILNAVKDYKGSCENDLISRIQAVKIPSVLSQHRKFALQTGELRSVTLICTF
ncbi:hypothetical protein RND71_000021 [Anisodus tanguticus]|uniref:Uncharacterized protein n=1 Tax=Anisodus tanguticus TaxID=243964 RepID=A0AAE1VXC1_9SOLA|nr:hypothetical protein RND71_000021 [Anisodus tanguticus]